MKSKNKTQANKLDFVLAWKFAIFLYDRCGKLPLSLFLPLWAFKTLTVSAWDWSRFNHVDNFRLRTRTVNGLMKLIVLALPLPLVSAPDKSQNPQFPQWEASRRESNVGERRLRVEYNPFVSSMSAASILLQFILFALHK